MNYSDMILKTRNKVPLSTDEIRFWVDGLAGGDLPDYQAAAWAMAVYFQGLTVRELSDLTLAMAQSGEMIHFPDISGIRVDKHSTGGVGDKTSLVVVPLVAASGIPVVKMSGRGLGHTGGTIDKLEAIPGFRVELSAEEINDQVQAVQGVIVSQSEKLVPADKRLYGIRDVTATVDSIPLIAASIMSKKIACGADALVLDVKVGSGAFMKTEEQALDLAGSMVQIGQDAGMKVMALISDMDQPLGCNIGNALEIEEAVDTLRGCGPADVEELSLSLAAHMIELAGLCDTAGTGRARAEELLRSGAGLEKFLEMVRWQGGKLSLQEEHYGLPWASAQLPLNSPRSGYIHQIDAGQTGRVSMLLGAGRQKSGGAIDVSAGLQLLKKRGDYAEQGQPLAILHGTEAALKRAAPVMLSAYNIEPEPPRSYPLVLRVLFPQR